MTRPARRPERRRRFLMKVKEAFNELFSVLF